MNAVEFDSMHHVPYTQAEEVLYDAINLIGIERPGLAALLKSAKHVENDGRTVTIVYPANATFAMAQWRNDENRNILYDAIKATMGPHCVVVREEGTETVEVERIEYERLLKVEKQARKLLETLEKLTRTVERGGDGC